MKRIIRLFSLILCFASAHGGAQPVAKTVLVEHFTNSYCSICGSRNPGFYQNLQQFPQVLHISYYPSSPYPACPINQYNKAEADARTGYYGVYGGTPRLVIQGLAISANQNYGDAAIFQNELGKTTSYAVNLQLKKLSNVNGEARLVIRKVDTSSLDSVSVYTAILQDTLFYASQNGEQVHYDVFRRSVWGTQPLRVKTPTAVGDSVVLTKSFPIDVALPVQRMYGIAVVQQSNGILLQASRSAKLPAATPNGIDAVAYSQLPVYPNPAGDVITIPAKGAGNTIAIFNTLGSLVWSSQTTNTSAINISALAPGNYFGLVREGSNYSRFQFTKK